MNNNAGDGIVVKGNNTNIDDITVNGSNGTAFNIAGDNSKVSDVNITGNNGTGININGNNATVKDVNVTGSNVTGVNVTGVAVTFRVNGAVYSRTTDANGYASLALNLAPGTHIVTVEYDGNSRSNTIVVKSIFSAKSTTTVKRTAKSTTIKITVKGKTKISVNFGATWRNQKVIVSIKGKTYQVKVNAQGKGTLKLTKAVTKTLKKNRKYTTSVFKQYTGKVKVNFNKKNYNVKINKGVANFKVTQKWLKT